MRFYRGITVSASVADFTIETIPKRGLQPGDGNWTMVAHDLKPRLIELWNRQILTTADTRPNEDGPPWVCACAEPQGATYYAIKHNKTDKHDVPLMITFIADPTDVVVDGRDFLYTLFQLGVPEKARLVAEQTFGKRILRYVDRAWSTEDQGQRVALCDLAVQDVEVIQAHAKNRNVILGRYNTLFRSAFFVRTPVPPEHIEKVEKLSERFAPPVPDFSIAMIRGLAD